MTEPTIDKACMILAGLTVASKMRPAEVDAIDVALYVMRCDYRERLRRIAEVLRAMNQYDEDVQAMVDLTDTAKPLTNQE